MSPTPAAGFRHILCPIDFSRHCRAALKYAAEIAGRSGARVTALVAHDPLLAAAAAAATYDRARLLETTASELRRFIDRSLGPAGTTIAQEVVIGDAGEQIDKSARRLGADLVVMGTHGLSGPRKWFFGSTTETVLRTATVPVLAVPARSKATPRSLRAFPGSTILAPIDLTGSAQGDARAARQAASRLGAGVSYLHVVAPLQAPPWIGAGIDVLDRQRVKSAERRLREIAKAAGDGAPYRVATGDPAEEIRKAASKAGIRAIILTLKRGGLFGPHQGSLTYRLLSSGVALVLALPASRR